MLDVADESQRPTEEEHSVGVRNCPKLSQLNDDQISLSPVILESSLVMDENYGMSPIALPAELPMQDLDLGTEQVAYVPCEAASPTGTVRSEEIQTDDCSEVIPFEVAVDEVDSTRPRKSSSRRQSRRQSYMTATKAAVKERELEFQQRQDAQEESDFQLAAEMEATEKLLQEMPGSVERKRSKRRSNSTSRKSPLSTQFVPNRQTRSRSSIEAESFSPIATPAVDNNLVQPEQSAIKIQALFRGWRERRRQAQAGLESVPSRNLVPAEGCTSLTDNGLESEAIADQIRPQSKESNINDVFSDFLSKWQSKKSQKAKSEDDLPILDKTCAPLTPRRNQVGTMSPNKSAVKTMSITAVLPSSVQRLSKTSLSADKARRTKSSAPKTGLPQTSASGGETNKNVGSKASDYRAAGGDSKPIETQRLPSPQPAPIEFDRKRKEPESAGGPVSANSRKRPRLATMTSIPIISTSSTLSSAPRRSKTFPAPTALRPVTPTTPKRLVYLTPAEITKTTRSFTSQNRLYRCDFERVVIRKEVPRPPSPTAKIQAKMASNARTKRRRLMKEKGYTFGAGDDEDYFPKMVTPERKTVKWGEDLEVDLATLPKTSPSKVRDIDEVVSCIVPVALDDFGNTEDNAPLTPELGKAQKVVITKYLYRGEQDD